MGCGQWNAIRACHINMHNHFGTKFTNDNSILLILNNIYLEALQKY